MADRYNLPCCMMIWPDLYVYLETFLHVQVHQYNVYLEFLHVRTNITSSNVCMQCCDTLPIAGEMEICMMSLDVAQFQHM